MPLYTYVIAFKGETFVAQGSYSNFRGFVSAWADLPTGVISSLTPALKNELAKKAYQSDFLEVPNRRHLWRKAIDLSGEEFVVYAIQTQI